MQATARAVLTRAIRRRERHEYINADFIRKLNDGIRLLVFKSNTASLIISRKLICQYILICCESWKNKSLHRNVRKISVFDISSLIAQNIANNRATCCVSPERFDHRRTRFRHISVLSISVYDICRGAWEIAFVAAPARPLIFLWS